MMLSLVFPVYNEAAAIPDVLEKFSRYCLDHRLDHELIVVNDGSSDQTSQVVRDSLPAHPHVRLVEHPTNLGYGAALRTGFTVARGEYLFFTDGDGQFSPADLDATLPLRNPQAIIIGYRRQRVEGGVRAVNSWLWTQLIRLTIGVKARDLNCAWKVFPRRMLSDKPLTSQGAFVSAELLAIAKKQGLQCLELPVQHFPRRGGQPTGANPRVMLRALAELGQYLWSRARR